MPLNVHLAYLLSTSVGHNSVELLPSNLSPTLRCQSNFQVVASDGENGGVSR